MQEPVETWRQAIAACLDAAGSEVVGRLHAIELAARYQNLDSEGRQNFLILLAEEFGPSPEAIAAATRAWQEATEVGPRIVITTSRAV